jgi:hypothetical protein
MPLHMPVMKIPKREYETAQGAFGFETAGHATNSGGIDTRLRKTFELNAVR